MNKVKIRDEYGHLKEVDSKDAQFKDKYLVVDPKGLVLGRSDKEPNHLKSWDLGGDALVLFNGKHVANIGDGGYTAVKSASVSDMLDKVADSLESKGFIKEAKELDKIANMLDKEAGLLLNLFAK